MSTPDLASRRCAPSRADTPRLSATACDELLLTLPGWRRNAETSQIEREFGFQNFKETMAFVNALAWIAEREDHHPDLEVGYRRCLVRYQTHVIAGLSESDFICAAKINALVEDT